MSKSEYKITSFDLFIGDKYSYREKLKQMKMYLEWNIENEIKTSIKNIQEKYKNNLDEIDYQINRINSEMLFAEDLKKTGLKPEILAALVAPWESPEPVQHQSASDQLDS